VELTGDLHLAGDGRPILVQDDDTVIDVVQTLIYSFVGTRVKVTIEWLEED
jgi:hypothetical protein